MRHGRKVLPLTELKISYYDLKEKLIIKRNCILQSGTENLRQLRKSSQLKSMQQTSMISICRMPTVTAIYYINILKHLM